VRGKAGAVQYQSQTESEALFRWIIMNIERAGSVEAGVRAALTPLIADGQYSSLNFLLARAGELYAFRSATRSVGYYSLYYLDRPAGGEFDVTSQDVFARLRSNGLAVAPALLVASEALGGEFWKPLELGQLLSLRLGQRPQITDVATA
jgi:glutamine amidotransferase